MGETWWTWIRRVVTFLLGVLVIVDALLDDLNVGALVVGLLLIGVMPLDDLLKAVEVRRHLIIRERRGERS